MPRLDGLFQQGHSKDHRPDLAQVKIMLATLDPLGLPLATEVVDGSRADDPLYEPTIEQVRTTLNRSGILYVGDSKMAAEATRTSIANNNDYYLMPLPGTIVSTEVLDTYLEPVLEENQTLTDIYHDLANGSRQKMAEGYEVIETRTVELDGEIVTWSERRLIVRSFKQAQAQEAALRKRLTKAEAAIAELSVRRQGKKRMTSLVELESATDDILKRFSVEGLISIKVSETIIKHHIRSYGNIPARTEKESIFDCETQINETVLKNIINRLGWRVYATNAKIESLDLTDAVLAYREQYIAERAFGRLKGQPLSLTPMYLQRDDHATGLIRLLSIGLRVLSLLEFVVRRHLSGASLAGIYTGNHKRETKRPTAETILAAFKNINLVIIPQHDTLLSHLTPLTQLQQRLLKLLGFPQSIYMQLMENHFF